MQYLASASVSLVLIDTGIGTALHWKQMDAIASIMLLAVLGYCLFFLVLLWQLGKRREWARRILLGLAYISASWVFVGLDLQLALVGPIQGNMLYKVYYYGVRIIYAMINASLYIYLTKSSVRDACQVWNSRTSASDLPQNAR